ncbi:MAG: ribonuclease H [Dehalococcoidia bacterium]
MSNDFTCTNCGDAFTVSATVRAKYPNWTPSTCMKCRGTRVSGSPAAQRPKAAAKPRRPGGTVTKELNLPVAEILERFTEGPDTGVFTDGSCAGNPGPGGWGAVWVEGGKIIAEKHGSDPATTNNRMELMAMIAGLEMLEPEDEITVYSDSQLVVNTLTKWAAGWEKRGWERKEGPVKNLELVQKAWALAKQRPKARIEWVRAHDGTRWNEYADALSTAYLREVV